MDEIKDIKPIVSIVIPSYNRANFIGETLESVLAQTYDNWECIVVDDGSTDDTCLIVEKYVAKDSRFQLYLRNSNIIKGASSCRNIGIEKSKGVYIQFLDSDDLLSNNKLLDQVNALQKKDSLTISTCRWGRFKIVNLLKSKEGFKSYQNFKNGIDLLLCFGKHNEFLPPMTYLIPKKLIELAGGWDESLSNNDDGEFFTRILLNVSEVIFVEPATVYYRDHQSDFKLSRLDNRIGVLSAIKSWKLIENHIFEFEGLKNTQYVKNAKKYILNSMNFRYADIVLGNFIFFKDELFTKIKKKYFG
ncbi:glycosyltransferase family 2 protein [Pseudotamlana agarivorans]|uniref:glycosyltransferase family 2 protein n=1 Tax=Pseudotamlana agarivorans TaxID=481183 RepID=UPI00083242A0|nr:glycosyltransferase family 2 protein [Tamlana agarivorans]